MTDRVRAVWIAGAITLFVAIAVPVGFWMVSLHSQIAVMSVQMAQITGKVDQLIEGNEQQIKHGVMLTNHEKRIAALEGSD